MGIAIILLCFLLTAMIVWWERRKTVKTMDTIEKMLDAAMAGSFSETTFDESCQLWKQNLRTIFLPQRLLLAMWFRKKTESNP